MSTAVIALAVIGYGLRLCRPADEADLLQAINNPNVGRYVADWYPQSGYTQKMAHDYVNGGADALGKTWAVTCNDTMIGSAGIHPQTGTARCNAEIGYWLAESHWGKDVGAAVVAALTQQAFVMPEITRVFAPIHAGNLASQRVCEKNGFVREGLLRQSTMKWGKAVDLVLWARYRNH